MPSAFEDRPFLCGCRRLFGHWTCGQDENCSFYGCQRFLHGRLFSAADEKTNNRNSYCKVKAFDIYNTAVRYHRRTDGKRIILRLRNFIFLPPNLF